MGFEEAVVDQLWSKAASATFMVLSAFFVAVVRTEIFKDLPGGCSLSGKLPCLVRR